MCNLQLLNLTDLSLIDDVMPDRAKFGCTKAASACTSDDIHMLVQSIWLRECVSLSTLSLQRLSLTKTITITKLITKKSNN